MRCALLQAGLFLVAALSWSLLCSASDDEPVEDLDDLDDEELEQVPGENADGVALGEMADKDYSETERKERMQSCFLYAMRRTTKRREEMKTTVQEMMVQHKEMSQEQALQTMIITWMMTCYMIIDQKTVADKTPFNKENFNLTDEEETRIFTPTSALVEQQVNSASQRQWTLLREVMVEQTSKHAEFMKKGEEQVKKLQEEAKALPNSASAEAAPKQFGMMYVLCAFGVIFGLGVLAVKRLGGDKGSASTKEKSSKSLRKEEKAKRELARKQK